MSFKRINIKNVKSLKNVYLNFSNITCIIGENGTGKTNVIKSLEFFQDCLSSKTSSILIDKANPYNDYLEITITYDFTFLNKIINSYLSRGFFSGLDSNFYNRIAQLSSFTKDNELNLTLRQNKNGNISWVPDIPYEDRCTLKNLFPIYTVKSRHINLVQWNDLWQIIGDFSKLPTVEFQDEMAVFFKNTFGESYTDTLDIIKNELPKNNIDVNKFSPQEKFVNILQLQLNGKSFNHKYEKLDYYSDGINSYNYLILLGSIIGELSKDKVKHPLIILDEPEIGLHPQNIDKLIKVYQYETGKPQVLLSTHSPRIVKNIIKSNVDNNIYHFSLHDTYTKIRQMKRPEETKEIYKITDQEAGYFFSKGIVFVEGDTEIELFNNMNIRNMFPFLNLVDFYSFDGNNIKLSIVHPKRKNINIPYLIVTDMDKIFKVDNGHLKIIKNNREHLNPLSDDFIKEREKYYFGKKRYETTILRKRIEGLERKCNFKLDPYWWFIESSTYHTFRTLVNQYCLQYNTFPVQTTIEGALVNENNITLFLSWLIEKFPSQSRMLNDLFNLDQRMKYRTTALRLIVNGKYDSLKTKGEFQKYLKENNIDLPQNIKRAYTTINKFSGKHDKTSGWVTEWINYVFINFIDPELDNRKKIKTFEMYFREVYNIICAIEKKVIVHILGE
jgi:AAA15 family ATPase/GTPase